MASRRPVVRICSKTTKPELHALLMLGWSRCIAKFGKGAFADALDISGPGIDKQLSGSMPDFETIMDAFDHDPSVLDDVFRTKGKLLVDEESSCDTGDAMIIMAKLLTWLAEAQHPDSPGGKRVTPSEVGAAEALIRQVHTATGNWLDQLNSHRGLTVVGGAA
jgi:hypothetical protein